jgi:hypothetical protein
MAKAALLLATVALVVSVCLLLRLAQLDAQLHFALNQAQAAQRMAREAKDQAGVARRAAEKLLLPVPTSGSGGTFGGGGSGGGTGSNPAPLPPKARILQR